MEVRPLSAYACGGCNKSFTSYEGMQPAYKAARMHIVKCRTCRNSKVLPVVLGMAGSDAVAGGSVASAVPRNLPPGNDTLT